jgi:hypothetical protein
VLPAIRLWVRFLIGSLTFIIDLILPLHYGPMALGSNHPLTEMSTRDLAEG